MGKFFYFILCGLIFCFALNILYFMKKHLKNGESKIFSILLIINLLSLISELLCSYIGFSFIENTLLSHITTKIYLICLMTFLLFMTLYIYVICYVTNEKPNLTRYNKLKNLSYFIYSICVLICIFLPIVTGRGYATGPAVNWIYTCSSLVLIEWSIPFIKNMKTINKKKSVPIILFVLFMIIISIIQKIYPEITLTTVMEFLIIFIMYHTIENPDMKMLREIQKSKEYAEQANTEKAMFLYNTSQELKTPVKSIQDRCEELLQEQDINEIINGIKDIKFAAKRLSSTISGTLDMNKMQATNIEIKVSRYSTKMLFQEMVSITKLNMKDKSLEFRVNLDDNIPEYLMGDSIRIKQIIQTIMNNAIKHTEKGFIEFNVSSVIKHDVCRLIITIEDSGSGMESKKLETLFYNTEDEEVLDEERLNNVQETKERLSVVKILTNLIGGTVIVNSELGKGTKFTVVLDQNIAEIKKTGTEIAIEKLSSNKRILVVDDEEESIKQITKVLNKYEVNVETAMWGQECLERIRKKQKYDLILLDEDMPRLNGIKTFEKLKIEENFNIPVVIMINSNHIDYKERYMYNGFSGCIVKPIKKTDIDKFIKKYIKEDE